MSKTRGTSSWWRTMAAYQPGRQWLYPADLRVQGTLVNDLLLSVPSTYRRLPRGSAEHVAGKQDFERRLHDTLVELKADIVVLDGLLVILDELVRRVRRLRGAS